MPRPYELFLSSEVVHNRFSTSKTTFSAADGLTCSSSINSLNLPVDKSSNLDTHNGWRNKLLGVKTINGFLTHV